MSKIQVDNRQDQTETDSPAIVFVEGGLAEVVHGNAIIIDFDGVEEPTQADLLIYKKNVELAETAEADQWVVDVLQLHYDNAKQNVVD